MKEIVLIVCCGLGTNFSPERSVFILVASEETMWSERGRERSGAVTTRDADNVPIFSRDSVQGVQHCFGPYHSKHIAWESSYIQGL